MSNVKSNHPGLIILFRVLFALMTLAVMSYIFFLSAESAKESSRTSAGLIEKVAQTFVPSYNEMTIEAQKNYVSSLQDIVRKMAHFTIFGVLGVSVACFASTFKGKFWLKLIFCQLFCSLYAAGDEYHQTFSEGRSFQLSDIAVDSIGSLCGILFVLLIVFIFVRIKSKGGEKVKKRELLAQVKAFENKLMEADAYIKQLTDIIADKDNEIRRLKDTASAQQIAAELPSDSEIRTEQRFSAEDEAEIAQATEVPSGDYHDFDFADTPAPENGDDINTYAVKAISKIVTESVKIGCLLASSESENKKELLNLALGRTEVAKNEISALVTAQLEPDLLKASIDKECALVMEYYQSILAQL